MANSLKTLETVLGPKGRSTCCGSWIHEGACWSCTNKAEDNDRKDGIFTMIVRTSGNPDFGQYAPITDPTLLSADTIEGLREAVKNHVNVFQIGGGNWNNPELKKNGKRVGFMSYNGRVWRTRKGWQSDADVEITTF